MIQDRSWEKQYDDAHANQYNRPVQEHSISSGPSKIKPYSEAFKEQEKAWELSRRQCQSQFINAVQHLPQTVAASLDCVGYQTQR